MVYNKRILKINFSFLLILFICQINLFGQGEWILNLKDGSSMSVELSEEFVSAFDNVTYRDKETGKKGKIHSSKLLNMHYLINGETLVYEKKYKLAKNFGKSIKRSSYDLWAAKIYETDKMEVLIFMDYFPAANNPYNKTFYTKTAFRIKSENYLIDAGKFSQDDDIVGYKAWSKVMCSTLKKAFKNICPKFSGSITGKSYFVDEYKKIADDFTKICN
jgi:hypothetical protein